MKSIVIAAILFCAALIGIGYYLTVHDIATGPRLVPVHQSYKTRIEAGAWERGNIVNPSVTVVEYSDLQCPACRALSPVMNQALAATKGNTKFVFRQFPQPNHNKAKQAGIAAEAAGRQGRFWDMAELIYARQGDWMLMNPEQLGPVFEDYAKTLQLNPTQFRQDTKDPEVSDQVDKDSIEAGKAGITEIPSIFINGVKVSPLPDTADELIALINQASNATPAL